MLLSDKIDWAIDYILIREIISQTHKPELINKIFSHIPQQLYPSSSSTFLLLTFSLFSSETWLWEKKKWADKMSRIVWAMCGWHLNYEGKHIHYEFPSKWKMLSLITRGKGEESLMIHVFLGKRYPPSSLPARTFYPLPPAFNYSIFFSLSKKL